MSKKSNRISQVLAHLAGAASAAAGGVTDAVYSAGQVVGDKYDEVKMTLEMSRLQSEQQKLFSDIGRTLFLIQSDMLVSEGSTQEAEMIDAQQTLDRLLLLADQKQQDIDLVAGRLSQLSGARVCAVCGKVCGEKDAFCSVCGAKLPERV